MNLISELDPSRQVTFDTMYLLAMNPHLRHYYRSRKEYCQQFIFDSDINRIRY